jgi:hypothetical protein
MRVNCELSDWLTFRYAGGDVDLIVSGSVMSYQLDPGLSQNRDDFRIEDANFIGGDVVSVHTPDTSVFPSGLEIL